MKNKNKMSVTQLTILTAVNMMGSGIIMLPTKLATIGTISVLSWLVTALGSVCLAYVFAKCGMYSRRGAGMGGYAEYSFGKAGSFLVNYTYAVSLVIANIAIAVAAVGYAQAFLGVQLNAAGITYSTIGMLWLTSILNFGGARYTGSISSITVWGVIIPVLGTSVVGWLWFDPQMYIEAWNPGNVPFFEGVSESIVMTLWAFLGLESACANSDAVDNPEKNVPKAVLTATIGVAAVYVLSTNVMAGIIPNSDLATSSAPFGLAFATMFGPLAGKVVMGCMVLSCFGSLLGWQFTISRVFKTSADEGYFPKFFSKVNSKDAPVLGMIVLTAIQSGLSLLTMSDQLYAQFEMLVNLAVVTNLVPYLLSMASVAVILESAGKESKLTLVLAFLGSLYSLYALYASGEESMAYGALVTFLGWTLYGFISRNYDMDRAKAWNLVDEQRKAA